MVLGTPVQETAPAIRRAFPTDAAALSDLAVRAKGHWGYDATFMAACRAELTLCADDLVSVPTFVYDGSDGPVGFYRLLVLGNGVADLDALFVDPAAIGGGVGKLLWAHAVAQAAALGCTELTVQSDPYAEGFYRAMGAQRVGESASGSVAGRMLPLLRFAVPQQP